MQLDVTNVTNLSKDGLMSEINALNYIDHWTAEDRAYRDKLEAEYYKRIEDNCNQRWDKEGIL